MQKWEKWTKVMAFYNFYGTPCVNFSWDNWLTTRFLTKEKNTMKFGAKLRSGETHKNPLKWEKWPKLMAFYNFYGTPCVYFSWNNWLTTRVLTIEKNPMQFGAILRSGDSPKNLLKCKNEKNSQKWWHFTIFMGHPVSIFHEIID